MLKPRSRCALRLLLGRIYYTIKRYLAWWSGKTRFARSRQSVLLPKVVIQHHTPLIRKLKDVDMWLQHNKVNNLRIAVNKINGIVIKPGETVSYWRLIGKPTRRKGYLEGMVLFYGGYYPGIGGGLCQLSNLIYWMTLHTPLTVTERWRHSYDVFPDINRTQPFGSGATCSYNYLDLQIYNGTGEDYQLHVYLTKEHLAGQWRAKKFHEKKYEVYEKSHWITQEDWGGYVRHNILHRKVYNLNHELLDDEYITENHAIMMYQPFLSEGI
ncbi:MAG: VanW family protein [Desulfitobacteriaceae bacterium]|nr:VanW family protein [Desulfitobacteriaceae bacterium]MDD4753600.1 VanW family protein [Desulfitobacteriaceae bacterium]